MRVAEHDDIGGREAPAQPGGPAGLGAGVLHHRDRHATHLNLGRLRQGGPHLRLLDVAAHGHERASERPQHPEGGHVGHVAGMDDEVRPAEAFETGPRQERPAQGHVGVGQEGHAQEPARPGAHRRRILAIGRWRRGHIRQR